MNDVLSDLEVAAPWVSRRVRRVPEAVRNCRCHMMRHGDLFFSWGPPRKMTPVNGYRLERTRNGHTYEPVADIPYHSFTLQRPAKNDGLRP